MASVTCKVYTIHAAAPPECRNHKQLDEKGLGRSGFRNNSKPISDISAGAKLLNPDFLKCSEASETALQIFMQDSFLPPGQQYRLQWCVTQSAPQLPVSKASKTSASSHCLRFVAASSDESFGGGLPPIASCTSCLLRSMSA